MGYIEFSENQITKKQHYIPKCYLKNFAIGNEKSGRVYIAFKGNKKVKEVSIEDICFRNFLYDQIAVDPDSGVHISVAPNEIENSFIELEGEYSTVVSKIKHYVKISNDFELTLLETGVLNKFMTSLMFRNPIFIDIINTFVNLRYAKNSEYIKYVKSLFADIPPNIFISLLANDILKMFISPDLGLFPHIMAESMKDFQFCVLKTESSAFITSTMPIVNIYGEYNKSKYDLLGMPITPHLFVAFVESVYRIPKVVTIDACNVSHINSRQVSRAMQISDRKDLLSYVDFSVNIEKEDDEWLYEMFHINKKTRQVLYKELRNPKEIKYWK